MVTEKEGGLEEIVNVFQRCEDTFGELNFEKGILQAIGYKEFHPYYQAYKAGKVEGEEEDLVGEVLSTCKEKLVIATVKFANY